MTRDEFLETYGRLIQALDETLLASGQHPILPGPHSPFKRRALRGFDSREDYPTEEGPSGALVDMLRKQACLPDAWDLIKGVTQTVRDPRCARYGPLRGAVYATDEEMEAWGLSTEDFLDGLIHPQDR